MRLTFLLLALSLFSTDVLSAGEVADRQQVRALLETKCLSCHGGDKKPRGGLDLRTRERLLKGGDSGPGIERGKATASLLYQRVSERDKPMPPGNPLTAEQKDLLRRWIDAGAPYDEEPLRLRRAGLDWWSLQPVRRPSVPAIRNPQSAIRNPIDAFILAKLAEKGLTPAPEADRRTLVRRLTYDLVGLPPTPEEIDAAVNDPAPDWYEKIVERLLTSPGYGERWARHWLDVVRFADSTGYEMNNPRPNAWPYRDWLIRAFNTDLPYPQMILEQLAGDTLDGADVLTQSATGYLVGGQIDTVFTALPGVIKQRRMDDLDDMIATTGAAFLGLTVNCARCHDHKFDPIGQKDYYALQAVFAGVRHGDSEVRSRRHRRELTAIERFLDRCEPLAEPRSTESRRPPVNAVCNVESLRPVQARYLRLSIFSTNDGHEPALDEFEVWTAEEYPRNVALALNGSKITASSTFEGVPFIRVGHLIDGRYGDGSRWVSAEANKGVVTLELAKTERIDRILWSRDRNQHMQDRLAIDYQIEVAEQPGQWKVVASTQDRRRYNPEDPPEPLVPQGLSDSVERKYRELVERRAQLLGDMLLTHAGHFVTPEPTHILERGDPDLPQAQVTAGGLAAVKPALSLPADAPESQRRLALARWLAHPDNPLTARVLVNRVWQWHFGQGLVSTPSDFGYAGSPPSHPELLDWLADEFVRSGWRLRHLHRLIVLSATYRQSGQLDEKALSVDRFNRLLWRRTPQRVEAEQLRDGLLAINGRLDRRMGGRGFFLWKPSSNYVYEYKPKEELQSDDYRRMVYEMKIRSQNDATFGVFDCPDASMAKPKRTVSTTVLQALNLLNARFALEQAETFAQRLQHEAGADVERQVERAFRLALGRRPAEREAKASAAVVRVHGLTALCRALFNANEFLYVD